MIDVRVDIDREQIRDLKKKLGKMKDKAPTVLSRAINSAATSTRAKMGQETKKRYNISSNKVKDTVGIEKASKSSLKAYVTSRGEVLKLQEYKFKVKYPLRAAVKKGGMKPLDGNPKGFIATMKGAYGGSHTDAYQRHEPGQKDAKKRRTRKPGKKSEVNKHNVNIHDYYGPSIPSIIKNEETIDALKKNAAETLEKRIEAEVNNILQRG